MDDNRLPGLCQSLLKKPAAHGSEEDQLQKKYGDPTKGATIPATMINLLKNMIGAGLLNVCIGFKYSSVVGGLIDMAISCFLCTCGFLMIGYCCAKTGAKTFRSLMCVTIGRQAGKVIDVILFLHTLFSCVGYITLIGDFSVKSCSGLFPGSIFARSRVASIMVITVFILFPLSLLRDLSSLKFTSALGLTVTAFACAYIFYDVVAYADDYGAADNLRDNFWYLKLDTFKTIALFNGSFSAHYNAPTYWAELRQKSFKRYAQVTLYSFAISTVLFTAFGLAGFARFGDDVLGNVLKGYSADDTIVQLSWMCMMVSTIFVFPLAFQRMRASWTALVNKPGGLHAKSAVPFTTIALLGVSVYFGTAFSDIAVIKMIKGATLGVSIMFIFPGISYLKLTEQSTREREQARKPENWGDMAKEMARQVSPVPTLTRAEEEKEPVAILRAFSWMLIFVGVGQGMLALLVHYKFL